LLLALVAGGPAVAWAQTPPPAAPATLPGITASFGAGFGVQYCCPDQVIGGMTGSVQIPVRSRWFAEGHFQVPTTSESTYDFGSFPNPFYVLSGSRHSTQQKFSGGGGMFYRFISGSRVSAFAGGGMAFRYRTTSIENTKVCQPIVPGSCVALDAEPRSYTMTDSYWLPQASAGIDVSVTKLVTLFGAVRIDDGVTPFGGVRFAITKRPAAPLLAPDVRVRATNGGDLKGRLVALTTTEVVIEQSGRSVVLPIGDVLRVEKRTHRIRNGMIAAAILGYVSGYFLSCGGGDENDCWPEVGMLVAGIGTGAGALVGWSMNQRAARDGRDVLYTGPGRDPAKFQLTPIVSPRRTGVGMVVRW
jgi:hypothetical protein